jgi:hypothetical protein
MKTSSTIDSLEMKRLAMQAELDRGKTQRERNRLGQFATPTALAEEILSFGRMLMNGQDRVRFIDPAIGTGSFYSAFLKVFPPDQIEAARGYEIDPHYGAAAALLWSDSGLKLTLSDFTAARTGERFNLLICNPPYVRHHHLSEGEKTSLQSRTLQACGVKIGGLAGLYCHFIGLAHAWLEDGAISGWLIPSEFMDVNYGQAVKRYLLEKVTLLHIHRFDPKDVQFADALVSSAVVWFRNAKPPKGHTVRFTFGGSLANPRLSKTVSAAALANERKWTRFPESGVRESDATPILAEFFKIKRGLATGQNSYFILSEEEIEERQLPKQCFRPILPSPRYVPSDEIEADTEGNPVLERALFLLDTSYDEGVIRERFRTLWEYIQEGRAQALHERYLCRHRVPWYKQENRPPAPIVCTYLGRGDSKSGRPFRFVLNHSKATVANVWLAMYPTPILSWAIAKNPKLIRRVWQALNSITTGDLLGEGRVYGGGLHKLEPKELGNVPALEIAELLPRQDRPAGQIELFGSLEIA